MVCVLPNFQKEGEQNPILKEFIDNESFYREKLIFITNRGSLYRLDKCCSTLNIILCDPKLSTYYFNTNDLNLIVDILLREVNTNTDPRVRVQIFKLIETVMANETYRQGKYRYEDVQQMVEETIMYEEEESKYTEQELECISSLNQYFQVERDD